MTNPLLSTKEPSQRADTPFTGEGVHVGVFDSGLGGLSVLRALQQRLPRAALTYVADSGHAPYGEREGDFIVSRSQVICDFLVGQRTDAIVVACNTATAAAIHLLRQAHPGVPIVGVEPGVKPALACSPRRRIGVLATPATLASEKYKRLIDTHAGDAFILPQPCPGLAKEIEQGDLDSPALKALVARFSAPLKMADIDTAVLGCTHYPFVAPLFRQALGPGVQIIDTSQAVAERAAHLCSQPAIAMKRREAFNGGAHQTSGIRFFTSGDPQHLGEVARHWLGMAMPVVAPLP